MKGIRYLQNLRNLLNFGGIVWAYFWEFYGGFGCRNFLGEFFCRNFLGEIFWEDFFWEDFFFGGIIRVYIELTSLSRFWFSPRFCLKSQGRKEGNFKLKKCESKLHCTLKKIIKSIKRSRSSCPQDGVTLADFWGFWIFQKGSPPLSTNHRTLMQSQM